MPLTIHGFDKELEKIENLGPGPSRSPGEYPISPARARPLALTDYRFTAEDREQIRRALEQRGDAK